HDLLLLRRTYLRHRRDMVRQRCLLLRQQAFPERVHRGPQPWFEVGHDQLALELGQHRHLAGWILPRILPHRQQAVRSQVDADCRLPGRLPLLRHPGLQLPLLCRGRRRPQVHGHVLPLLLLQPVRPQLRHLHRRRRGLPDARPRFRPRLLGRLRQARRPHRRRPVQLHPRPDALPRRAVVRPGRRHHHLRLHARHHGPGPQGAGAPLGLHPRGPRARLPRRRHPPAAPVAVRAPARRGQVLQRRGGLQAARRGDAGGLGGGDAAAGGGEGGPAGRGRGRLELGGQLVLCAHGEAGREYDRLEVGAWQWGDEYGVGEAEGFV
ncbi:hypothetical protein LTR53_011825, partial [Teratosphaeriaceae sp. CCFEE 6253]